MTASSRAGSLSVSSIHSSTVVEDGAQIGAGARIGPFCHVGAQVTLGEGVELVSHVVIAGRTTIGARTRIFPFASIGHQPQDLKFHGEASELLIGADCLIREGVTMNPGTEAGGLKTLVGDKCAFLANSHVAHDCKVGNNVIFSNNVMLAGHCQIGDYAILGGGCGIHQYVRIGPQAIVQGLAAVGEDVIPYGMAAGNRAYLAGLNLIGLKRRGFSREQIHDLRRAYRLLFAPEGTLKERVEDVAQEFSSHPEVHFILDFIRDAAERSICVPRDLKEGVA